jgi:hypothetical protein
MVVSGKGMQREAKLGGFYQERAQGPARPPRGTAHAAGTPTSAWSLCPACLCILHVIWCDGWVPPETPPPTLTRSTACP